MKNNPLFDGLNKKHHSTTVRFFIRSLKKGLPVS